MYRLSQLSLHRGFHADCLFMQKRKKLFKRMFHVAAVMDQLAKILKSIGTFVIRIGIDNRLFPDQETTRPFPTP